MKVNEAFPGQYLKADDLGTARPVVTISEGKLEDIGGDQKPVAYFRGKQRGLVLNKTNATHISEITGTDEMDDWAGATFALFATKTEYQGKRVPCIRIAEVEAKPEKRAAKPAPAEEFADDDGLDEAMPF